MSSASSPASRPRPIIATWTRDQLRPYIDHVIDCFGPDRILYGGDWPVSELAGGYLQWLATLDWATAGFSPAEKRKLFRDNAIKSLSARRFDGHGDAATRMATASPRLRALARRRLPRMLFDMVDGAAGDEITMRRNEAALAEIELAPKLLAGAPTRDQSVELFGAKLTSPVIIGPTGPGGAPVAARRARRGARGGAVRHDLLHEPRLDRDHRSDRRGDATARNGCRSSSTRTAA